MRVWKHVAPEIIFGRGSISQVGESALRLGAEKVFVVSDEGVAGVGWVEKALFYLKRAGLPYEVFLGVTSNPKDYEVQEGVQKYEEAGCDVIVAVGGGSPIDVAKSVAVVASNGGRIADYEGINKINRPLPPMVMVPTTAGSASEVTQFAIVVDVQRKLKMAIISHSLVPDIAVIDPELLQTKSAELTAVTGVDALSHAIESYVSLAATPLTEVHSLNAIRLINGSLRESVACRTNIEAKEKMAMASLQAGLAFSNAILGVVHAMVHQIDGYLDRHHGESNACILPYAMEFNLVACPKKFKDIARALGEDVTGLDDYRAGERAVLAVRRLIKEIGLPSGGLRELGVKEELIPVFSQNALNDACLVTNPRDCTGEDIASIYRRAL